MGACSCSDARDSAQDMAARAGRTAGNLAATAERVWAIHAVLQIEEAQARTLLASAAIPESNGRTVLQNEEAQARTLLSSAAIPEGSERAELLEEEVLGRALLTSAMIPENNGRTGVLLREAFAWAELCREWAPVQEALAADRKARLSRKQMLRRRQQRWNAKHRQQGAGAESPAGAAGHPAGTATVTADDSAPAALPGSGPVEVSLMVYKLGIGYHSGVAVRGMEYYFGGCMYFADHPETDVAATGIQRCRPRQYENAKFQEAIPMGRSAVGAHDIERIIADMAPDFSIGAYHLLKWNCNHFADALLARLGCPGLPAWVNRAARRTAVLVPDNLYNWVARRVGMQKRRPKGCSRAACGCGAHFGLFASQRYCRACGMACCKECTRGRRVVPLHGPHPVPVCKDCAERPDPVGTLPADRPASAGSCGG